MPLGPCGVTWKLVLLLALGMYFLNAQHAYSFFVFLDAGVLCTAASSHWQFML